jgi:putative transposase
MAATHARYGHRRLTVLLRRKGWKVSAKRVYRLYDEENLKVRSTERKKIARANGPNQCWSADFVSDKLSDSRAIRTSRSSISSRGHALGWKQIAR